ncbi:MAG TPA: hypothetical protein VGO75_04815 [Gemmatimonadaceae bacterium]|nr:hypothetical protein [Gemmatimonadaceae bacterium]
MRRALLFVTSIAITGVFAALGSMIGHFAGSTGVLVGGVIGGLIGVSVATRIAVWRGWIEQSDRVAATIGGRIGFALAAFIAVKTLSSPVGPIFSTLLVGIGAVAGPYINQVRKREGF